MTFTDELFPFRFAFDRDLAVQEVGTSLRKLAGGFQCGTNLRELVVVRRPQVDLDFENLSELAGLSIDLWLVDEHITMRCQFVVESDRIMVVGTPRFDSVEAFEDSGLDPGDFAAHDVALESLFGRESTHAQHDDPRTARLGRRRVDTEPSRVALLEEDLAHALSAAGDIHLRVADDDTVVEARASRPGLLPCSPTELIGRNIYESFLPIATPLRTAVTELEATGGSVAFAYGVIQGGEQLWFDARVTATHNGGLLLLARDVTEQRRLRSNLEHQATHDPLTDLPNRKLFIQRVETALDTDALVAVLFLDLDSFKLVNDRHGHQLGDKVLLHVAETVRRCIRRTDLAARLGGDEFAVLLTGIESKQAAECIAQRLVEELQKSVRIDHRNMSTSVSIGIATSYDAKDVTALLQFADIAMYQAKSDPKCRFVSFESSMYEDLVRRDTMQRQLIAAGVQEQFVNHYQPIVDVSSRRIRAFEALARWQHPIRGLLLPHDFIASAEESNAIVQLGEQSLSIACRDANTWTRGWSNVHFNVSTMQLSRSCLSSFLSDCLQEHEFPATRLTAEIKEKTLQHDFKVASREIDKLRDLGVSVALDEFGAGNYSLAFLERLPIRSVKLARDFVQQLGQSEQKNQLVKSVVQLAQTLDLDVIAVGVETLVQQELLMEFGCVLAQGILYSPPITSSDVNELGTHSNQQSLLTV